MMITGRVRLPGWLSHRSRLLPVWMWHALFDGTPLCWCAHSAEYRRVPHAGDSQPGGLLTWECLPCRQWLTGYAYADPGYPPACPGCGKPMRLMPDG